MQAYWLDSEDEQIRPETLRAEGVLFDRLPTDPKEFLAPINEVKAARGYIQQDEVALAPTTPKLDEICAKFIDEHYHDEDEVRFVLEGEGIFDIRTGDDRWMRVKVGEGDLIVVPAKRNHRFMLTESKTIRCVRLFKDMSGWAPHYRQASR